MSNETKHDNVPSHGSYEHQDLQPSGILYFLLSLVLITVVCLFALKGLYAYLDRRDKASQPEVNPLVTNVPTDTRHVAAGYPQTAFPNPKLEEDERGQLNGILLNEQSMLYTYGWVDEKAGTVRIPIDRAMDLIVQRGLPVRPQTANEVSAAASKKDSNRKESNKTAAGTKVVKK